ncbi:alpha/beta hydrolase [Pseudomonas schmalbachii]|uniref:Alpha/beta hydrolase n=1 Tax=Pseudomonas schmalbachii TaxID=2816993 RepID=A0ABS3TUG9_9PSED|nr:alpha/beta hydrolase [Pseudomonas schmalbachii]MBO3277317.1 alpha/beta hydrolase [Pseudomonas schmalbachii]
MNNKKVRQNQQDQKAASGTASPQAPNQNVGLPKVLRAREPDREARAILRMLNLSPQVSLDRLSVDSFRKGWLLAAKALGRRIPVASVTEQVIVGPGGPMTLRIFKPSHTDELLPAFLWCFGGGFVIGGLDSADSVCRNIAHYAGCITVAISYRLAPEHTISASREDVLAAVNWIAENGAELGIDTTRLALGGDSAGGNLTAAISQELLRRDGPTLRMQVMVYPATELVEKFPSYEENIHGRYFLTAEAVAWLEERLSESLMTLDIEDPWYSPRRSPDLRGLPPAVIVTAGFDPIRDDGLDYGVRLRAAGVPVEMLHYAGQFHGFINFDSVLGAARDVLKRISEALVAAFDEAPAADRTIEIADEPSPAGSGLRAAGELTTATVTVWAATVRWRDMLLRMASPRAARATRLLLKPWSLPTALLRRRINSRLDTLSARQTYPHACTCPTKQRKAA